jgi:hypothetical protein
LVGICNGAASVEKFGGSLNIELPFEPAVLLDIQKNLKWTLKQMCVVNVQ